LGHTTDKQSTKHRKQFTKKTTTNDSNKSQSTILQINNSQTTSNRKVILKKQLQFFAEGGRIYAVISTAIKKRLN
jgi:hypothetical protein